MPKVGVAPIRRRQVIEAVHQILEQEGWRALTIKRMSQRASVSTGILSHYFGSKDGVLDDAIQAAHDRFAAEVLRIAERNGTAGEKLAALIDRLVPPSPVGVPGWAFWLAVWGQMPFEPKIRKGLKIVYRRYSALVATILEQGARAGEIRALPDPNDAADRFIALADGVGLACLVDPERMPPERLRSVLTQFWEDQLGISLRVAHPISLSTQEAR